MLVLRATLRHFITGDLGGGGFAEHAEDQFQIGPVIARIFAVQTFELPAIRRGSGRRLLSKTQRSELRIRCVGRLFFHGLLQWPCNTVSVPGGTISLVPIGIFLAPEV